MNKLIISFVIFLTSTQFPQDVTRQEIEEINAAVTTSCGQEYSTSDIIQVDRLNNTMWQYGFEISDTYLTLAGCYVFLASAKFPGDDINTFGIIGIYKNGIIIWKSDPLIKCLFNTGASVDGIIDLNLDGYIDIITSWYSGKDGQLADVWILSWNGTNGWFINGVDEEGLSKISQGDAYDIGILDTNGDNILEICVAGECYYWDGILYSSSELFPELVPKDRLTANVNCRVNKVSEGYRYEYMIINNVNSLQKIVLFGISNESENVSNFTAPTDWNFSISGGFDFLRSDVEIPVWNYAEAFIKPGDEMGGYSFMCTGLPKILNIYFQGYNTNPDFDKDKIKSNSFITKTLAASDPPSPFIPLNFLDTLINHTASSHYLGWITNQNTADKYDSLFNTAKSQLQQNSNSAARATLQSVLQQVDIDSTSNLTSEAYALLRYNTEYLVEKLPLQSQLNLDVINPSMSMKNPGAFTMDLEGSGFSSNSVVYFNGQARATILASDDTLNAEILASDVSEVGNFPVWVSDGTTNSDTLMFSVVNSLPKEILPIMNCVMNNGNGTYTAYFGYNNKNSVSVYVPVYSQNKISPEPWDRGQPGVFKVGVWERVFSVTWTSGNIIWHLNNNTAKAKTNSPPCQ